LADFDKALAYTLKHEGGWADDPDDPGGATNYGITLRVAKGFGIESKEALRLISWEMVRDIYRTGYWTHGGVKDQRVASKLFDMAVNMGPAAAMRLFRGAIEGLRPSIGSHPEVSVTIWGKGNTDAANAPDPAALLDRLRMASEGHYRAIAARRPASAKFLNGWLKRAREVPNE
jgi:type VI secretion system secreted protein VgrG